MCENTRVFTDVPLKDYTTFKIGGNAERLVVTDDAKTLAREYGGALLIGCGSNLLVGDGGVKGTVIRFCSQRCEPEILSQSSDGAIVYISGAVKISRFSRFAATNGLSGLEWASKIPGTVGGAVKMNAGAHGGDVKSILVFADVLKGEKTLRTDLKELKLGYRTSGFDGAVVGAAFALIKSSARKVCEETERLCKLRSASQPSGASAGSVYKAADGVPAYKYIVESGLAGLRIGGAKVSEKHANFIINEGGATARDVLELMNRIESEVYRRFGVVLVREVKTIGEF